MKNLFVNWKTTSLGITSIVSGIGIAIFVHPFTQETLMMVTGAILVGVGFLFAKDGDVTGGTKQQ